MKLSTDELTGKTLTVETPGSDSSIPVESAIRSAISEPFDPTTGHTHDGIDSPTLDITETTENLPTSRLEGDIPADQIPELSYTRKYNYIHNGEFMISQRGSSFTGMTVDQVTYTLDMWKLWRYNIGTTQVDVYHYEDSPEYTVDQYSSNRCLRCQITSSSVTGSETDAVLCIAQPIEGIYYRNLHNNTVTVSFCVKASKAGTYSLRISAISETYNKVIPYTIFEADTWELKKCTFVCDTPSGYTLTATGSILVVWSLFAGSSYRNSTDSEWTNDGSKQGFSSDTLLYESGDYLQLAHVQLVLGEDTECYHNVPYPEDLRRCYRYFLRVVYYNLGIILNGSQVTAGVVTFPVPMRAAPSFSNASFVVTGGSVGTPACSWLLNSLQMTLYNSSANWTANNQACLNADFSAEM